MGTQWEYESCTLDLSQEPGNRPDAALNRMGLDCWELVGFERSHHGTGALFVILKRPKKFKPREPRASD